MSPIRETLRARLLSDYFYRPPDANDLAEHLHKREDRIREHIVPWVGKTVQLGTARVLEIGCGTGSSTAAFAPWVKEVVAFEIEAKSVAMAQERLRLFGIGNAQCIAAEFHGDSDVGTVDVVLLFAVLEHMTWEEMERTVTAAWRALRPGGVLVVCETPNRLAPKDYHTSWLPFFQVLPPEIQRRYYRNSTRAGFVSDLDGAAHLSQDDYAMHLTRWGRGVSYHEFEILFGRAFHDWIVADGYEREILPIAPRFADDDILRDTFKKMDVKVSRAFCRWFLYFIARKPA
jgi:SAM-dependent methyltransferase